MARRASLAAYTHQHLSTVAASLHLREHHLLGDGDDVPSWQPHRQRRRRRASAAAPELVAQDSYVPLGDHQLWPPPSAWGIPRRRSAELPPRVAPLQASGFGHPGTELWPGGAAALDERCHGQGCQCWACRRRTRRRSAACEELAETALQLGDEAFRRAAAALDGAALRRATLGTLGALADGLGPVTGALGTAAHHTTSTVVRAAAAPQRSAPASSARTLSLPADVQSLLLAAGGGKGLSTSSSSSSSDGGPAPGHRAAVVAPVRAPGWASALATGDAPPHEGVHGEERRARDAGVLQALHRRAEGQQLRRDMRPFVDAVRLRCVRLQSIQHASCRVNHPLLGVRALQARWQLREQHQRQHLDAVCSRAVRPAAAAAAKPPPLTPHQRQAALIQRAATHAATVRAFARGRCSGSSATWRPVLRMHCPVAQ